MGLQQSCPARIVSTALRASVPITPSPSRRQAKALVFSPLTTVADEPADAGAAIRAVPVLP